MAEQNQKADTKKSAKKILTPKEIAEDFQAAKKWLRNGQYTKEDARWKHWEKNKKYLMCDWPDTHEDDVNVNTVRANYSTVRPTLYFKNPKITGSPTKPNFTRDLGGNIVRDGMGRPILIDNYAAARIASIKVNYELKEIGFKHLMRQVTSDVICPYGVGWAKIGYSINSFGGHDTEREPLNHFWIQRVDPRLLCYSWRATNINKAITHETLIMTTQDAEEFGFDIPDGYVPKLPDFLDDRSKIAKAKGENKGLFICTESYDPKNRMLYWTLCSDKDSGNSKTVKAPVEEPYPFDGSCYVPLVLNDDNDDIIGLSDVEPVEDQILAINRLRTKQTKHIEWYGTKTVYEDGAIEPSEIEKTKVTDHGVYLKLTTGGLNRMREVTPTAMGQDNYAMINEHKDDIRTTLGISEFMQGSVGAASTKATIGNIVQNASIARIEEKRDIIRDFVIDCVRKLFACIQKFSSDEEYLNIKEEVVDEDFVGVLKKDYGYDPNIPFLRMSREDIQGEFNFDFNVEDMVIQPKEVRAQQFMNFLNVVFANPLLAQKYNDLFDVGKTLKKGAELFGVDLGDVRKGGPVQLPAEQENQMFMNGMEVPEPNAKDNDDEHILSHDRLLQPLDQQLQSITSQIQQMQQFYQQALQQSQMNGTPPPPEPTQAIQALTQKADPLQNLVRKIKLHQQAHDMARQRKEAENAGISGGGGAGPMPQGQPAASMQAQMQGQAGGMQ